jgi:hypothetical protein
LIVIVIDIKDHYHHRQPPACPVPELQGSTATPEGKLSSAPHYFAD